MKHFLKITYNVFKFHLDYIIPAGGLIGVIFGGVSYWIFGDKITAALTFWSAIAGQIVVAYYKEYQRFKEKGHY